MGDDREEFVETWPGNGPCGIPFREARDLLDGSAVKRRILAVRVD
jgi:hypothetical protein